MKIDTEFVYILELSKEEFIALSKLLGEQNEDSRRKVGLSPNQSKIISEIYDEIWNVLDEDGLNDK